ncbi:MAG: hypothetical protein ABI781_13895 [Burkholderiales bacterium]
MNHPPKQLALLISLIGGGISPYAQARIDEQRVDLAQTMPGLACTALEAAALPACATAGDRDLVWQPQRSALDLSATAGVLVLYGAPGEDWAPGEAPGAATPSGAWRAPAARASVAATTVVQAATPAEVPRAAVVRERTGKSRRVRVLAKAVSAPIAQLSALAKLDGFAPERIERVQVEAALSAPAVAPASAGSIEVERLLANLAMVLGDTSAPVELAEAAPIAEAAAASEPPAMARLRAASPVQLERPAVAVETQTGKVLRSLGAILSDDRDEVGAIQRETPQPTVTTQSGKVMAMLGQISSVEPPVVENGAAKRLRKLAARATKAQAVAEATEREAALNGVDVLLPLELHTFAALPAASFASLPRLALQAAPPIAAVPAPAPLTATGAKRASPFGDRQVAISEGSLDRVRGGYAGEGLNISFGIERAIYINGSLVTTTSLNVVDLGQISAGRGGVALDSGTIALIQNGAGNVVAGGSISSTAMGTIVQNTLDGQKIQNVTTINATANSLGVFRTLNLQSSLRGAVIDSLRR